MDSSGTEWRCILIRKIKIADTSTALETSAS